MILGDLGADVVKVERPGSGDETRSWGPPFGNGGLSAYFLSVNRNKLSVALDLDSIDDRGCLLGLIAGADIVIYDSMFTDEEYARSYVGWGHSTWQEAVRLCKSARVKRLVVFHHDPDHDDERLDAIGRELEAAMPGAIMAREGLALKP